MPVKRLCSVYIIYTSVIIKVQIVGNSVRDNEEYMNSPVSMQANTHIVYHNIIIVILNVTTIFAFLLRM